MQETFNDFEELEESEFPAFPVVFRPEPEETSQQNIAVNKSRVAKGNKNIPDKEVK